MKLYSIQTRGGDRLDWAGTQTDAKHAAHDQRAKHPDLAKDIFWAEDEVPVDKTGLLAWLKENAVTKGKSGE